MMPRVTVICLCYNQALFVADAVHSVLRQTYHETELIVVNDASTDNSHDVIMALVSQYPQIRYLPLKRNTGNCAAFNRGLALATGDYVIDLAADDLLMPERVAHGVRMLEAAGPDTGVHFSDALLVNEMGVPHGLHSDRFPHHTIPQGDVYRHLVSRYFICPTSMMFTRRAIDFLGGYDETLAYEDFDFWIRSSRHFLYSYSPEVLVSKRIVANSMTQQQFRRRSPQLRSTLAVCGKIMDLNRTAEEQAVLAERLRYEIRMCVKLLNLPLAAGFFRLYLKNRKQRYG